MNKICKLLIAVAVCAFAYGLCACNTQQSTPTQTAEAVKPTATVETTDTVKTGVVISASMHNLTIEAPDGTTYSFITDDTTEVLGEGENLGSTVSVEYAGEYKENILARKINILKAAEEHVSASVPEVKSNTDTAVKSAAVPKYITGVVKDAAMHNITVEWNGRDYVILKDDMTTVEGNVTVGTTVRVYHTGDIDDGVTAIDISVVAPEIVNEGVKYITGKVVDVSMNAIVIENGGHNYNVKKDDNTKSDEVATGDTVRVFHKGGLADGMTATSIIKQ